jgi:hypothetical protein
LNEITSKVRNNFTDILDNNLALERVRKKSEMTSRIF